MTCNLHPDAFLRPAALVFASIPLLLVASCSTPKPPPPPVVVTRVSPGQPAEGSNYGAQAVANTTTARATVLSINSLEYEISLQRADGRIAKCKARGGIKDFRNLKVGDEVTILVGEERAVALGKTDLPPESERAGVRVPEDMVALADTVETKTFTAKIVAIDQWNRKVTLRMADGSTRSVPVSVAVNLADFSPGDEVTVRISEIVVLVVPVQTP
jgi:hypothetical protein